MRALIYDTVRQFTGQTTRQWLKSQRWFNPVSRFIFGYGLYSMSYYSQIESYEASSVEIIAEWMSNNFPVSKLIDVGCGPGHLTRSLATRGFSVLGIDISDASERLVKAKGLPFQRYDLTKIGVPAGGPWDLAVCCEVAEHLDEKFAAVFVKNLVSLAKIIYLTAAEPSAQRGVGLQHLNEQPNSYWISLFAGRGFTLDIGLTASARQAFSTRVVDYLAKPMVFRPLHPSDQ